MQVAKAAGMGYLHDEVFKHFQSRMMELAPVMQLSQGLHVYDVRNECSVISNGYLHVCVS